MPKLPRVTSAKTLRALEKLGFVKIRQKGSHIILKKQISIKENDRIEKKEIGCVVPMHNKTLATGTLKNILKQANISIEEFVDVL